MSPIETPKCHNKVRAPPKKARESYHRPLTAVDHDFGRELIMEIAKRIWIPGEAQKF